MMSFDINMQITNQYCNRIKVFSFSFHFLTSAVYFQSIFFLQEKQNSSFDTSNSLETVNDSSLGNKQQQQPIIIVDPSIVSKALNMENDEEQSKSSSITMKRIFATFLSSSSFQPLKLPFVEEEHFILNCESNIYYVNEKDLSSIVAFTLR